VRIVCIGGGPAVLYLALLMKRVDPRHDVSVIERNRPYDTFGWVSYFRIRRWAISSPPIRKPTARFSMPSATGMTSMCTSREGRSRREATGSAASAVSGCCWLGHQARARGRDRAGARLAAADRSARCPADLRGRTGHRGPQNPERGAELDRMVRKRGSLHAPRARTVRL
jgi:hypothetical protein